MRVAMRGWIAHASLVLGVAVLACGCSAGGGGEDDDPTPPAPTATEEQADCGYGPPRAANDPYRVPCEEDALFCDGNELHQCLVGDTGCSGWAAVAPLDDCEAAIRNGTGPRY
jgi:hypothetical protein